MTSFWLPELAIFLCVFNILMLNDARAASKSYISSSSVKNQSTSNDLQHSNYEELFCLKEETCNYNCSRIICSDNGPLLSIGCCATYSEDTGLISFTLCPNFLALSNYNVTKPGHIQLPRNLSQLNDYMCGPLNRKGLVCSECADGFGPSVTSFGYKCVNCTEAWYGVPLFLFLEFVPITVFYLIILIFQISIISAPMPCFIMYAQITTIYLNMIGTSEGLIRSIIFANNGVLRTDMKIIHTFYGIFNLDFFRLLFPPFCISTRLKSLYVACFGYISVLYPILLIFLTWVCVELHGRNFRPLVWLWRPFHRCFVRLRRGWDTKSDIIDVFTTFFLLSYSKHLYQSFLLEVTQIIVNYNASGTFVSEFHRSFVDLSLTIESKDHLLFSVPAVAFSYAFIILPPLLLLFYPIRAFRSRVSKFHFVNIFVERVYGCYRNGLDGGRDMRSLSALYFFLRIVIFLTAFLSKKLSNNVWSLKAIWFPAGTVFFVMALIITLVQPYKRTYMNCLDALIHANLALLCYVITSVSVLPKMVTTRILLFTPIVIFLVMILQKKLLRIQNIKSVLFKWCGTQCGFQGNPTSDSEEQQPLLQTI